MSYSIMPSTALEDAIIQLADGDEARREALATALGLDRVVQQDIQAMTPEAPPVIVSPPDPVVVAEENVKRRQADLEAGDGDPRSLRQALESAKQDLNRLRGNNNVGF